MCKNLRDRYAVAIVIVLLIALLAACGGGTSSVTNTPSEGETSLAIMDGETLLQERCTQCHNLSRTTSEQQTRDQWEKTVVRMVQKGTKLTEDEQTVLIDYLAETYTP